MILLSHERTVSVIVLLLSFLKLFKEGKGLVRNGFEHFRPPSVLCELENLLGISFGKMES
jgi:hypothetical protein